LRYKSCNVTNSRIAHVAARVQRHTRRGRSGNDCPPEQDAHEHLCSRARMKRGAARSPARATCHSPHTATAARALCTHTTRRGVPQQSALTVRAFLASLLPATVVKAKVCHCNSDGVSLHLPAPPTGVSGIDGLEGVSEQFPRCHDNSDFAVPFSTLPTVNIYTSSSFFT